MLTALCLSHAWPYVDGELAPADLTKAIETPKHRFLMAIVLELPRSRR